MRGVYTRARFPERPAFEVLAREFRDAHVCWHEDIRGGVMVELVTPASSPLAAAVMSGSMRALGGQDVESFGINAIDYFYESVLAAGGCVLAWDAGADCMETFEPTVRTWKSTMWWESHGWLASATDAVALVHPRAPDPSVHAESFLETLLRARSRD